MVAVSYTHLDVYKRQKKKRAVYQLGLELTRLSLNKFTESDTITLINIIPLKF